MAEARGYHHGDLRASLILIARELVRESGPDGWSMREASRRAGVSQAAPYRHFADKTALLDAVGAGVYSELEARYGKVIDSGDAKASALAVAQAYLQYAFDEPRLFRLIFSSPKLHETAEAVHSYRVFEQAIRSAQEHGALPAGSTAMLAHVIWCGVHGVADLVLSGSLGRRHGTKVAKRLLAALFCGLRESS